ncbi:hypothetical protein [Rubinisphaera margarita]|uniref:hypothetical protein n=1 Tax=Rubinisphaera margarita TaxID=2909586 RepID=UPI001EE8873B|nr:hypothetical protein [Rubinisphaera margarita]MCG6158083.1 hypothetical protein [Rubinisphaera margarita]
MLEIERPRSGAQFEPGQVVPVDVRWSLLEDQSRVELRLVWNTVGKGDQNLSIEETWTYSNIGLSGQKHEEIQLPDGPYSCSGKLLSLVWAFELIVFPSGESTRTEFLMAPGASEIILHSAAE